MEIWVTIAIGFAIAIGQTVYSRLRERSKKPIWYYKTNKLISKSDKLTDDIRIHFREQIVSQVSSTRIGFVNVGKEPIERDDIKTPNNQISIKFDEGVRILQEPKIIRKHRDDIDFDVKYYDAEVLLSFNIVDYLDGAIIEVVHTGDENTKLEIKGIIYGVPKGIEKRGYRYASKRLRRYSLISASISGIFLILSIGYIVPVSITSISLSNINKPVLIITIVIMVLGLLLSIIDHITQYRRTIPSFFNIEE